MTTLLVPGTAKTSLAIAETLAAKSQPYVLAVRLLTKAAPNCKHTGSAHPTVHLDLGDRSTWSTALVNNKISPPIDKIYLLPPPLPDFVPVLTDFIHNALRSTHNGIQRIVLLSSTLISLGGPAHGQIHALLDKLAQNVHSPVGKISVGGKSIEEPNLPSYAVLRPTWFTANFSALDSLHSVTIPRDSKIYSATTASGKIPFVDVADIAAVAYHALTDSFSTASATLPPGVTSTENGRGREFFILGPDLETYASVASHLSRVLNRPIQAVDLSVGQLSQMLINELGMAEDYATILAGLDGVIAGGAEEELFVRVNGGCVTAVTGRQGQGVEAVLEEAFSRTE